MLSQPAEKHHDLPHGHNPSSVGQKKRSNSKTVPQSVRRVGHKQYSCGGGEAPWPRGHYVATARPAPHPRPQLPTLPPTPKYGEYVSGSIGHAPLEVGGGRPENQLAPLASLLGFVWPRSNVTETLLLLLLLPLMLLLLFLPVVVVLMLMVLVYDSVATVVVA